jgi:hypothetical protein
MFDLGGTAIADRHIEVDAKGAPVADQRHGEAGDLRSL